MAKRIRVVTGDSQRPAAPSRARRRTNGVVVQSENPQHNSKLTSNEVKARLSRRYATATTLGGLAGIGGSSLRTAADVLDSGTNQFYSPQLSTDFLEKPQNLRERRAFYRFFYNSNEIIGQAIDIHSTLPLSKIKLVPPKGTNYDQNMYVYRFFENMCEDMKLFKALIEITHEYWLFGNCTGRNTPIRTKEGYKRAEDIKVGDLVFTHKCQWKQVTKTCSRRADRMLRIHTYEELPPVDFTEEHPFEVVVEKDTDKTEFVKAGDLKEGCFIRFLIPDEGCGELIGGKGERGLLGFEKKWREVYNGTLKKPKLFHGEISYGETEHGDGISGIKVSRIEEIEGDIVYNFEVEDDHTFQAGGFSTHNCFIFAEEDDTLDNRDPNESGNKKEESRQRSEFLKQKYKINDKNPLYKGWKKLLVLPPDQVRVRKLPLTDEVAIEYVPDPETKKWITGEQPLYPDQMDGQQKKYDVPIDIQEKVRTQGVIPLDTDPNTGSHVYHLARKKSQYEPLGVSIIERCINTLVLMDKLRQAQTSIASRHMTPMRIVWAEDLSTDDVDNLREQVDLALVDPDFSIIANYEVHWEEMGSQGRLLDIEADYEGAMNRLYAGLGVTREVLTGEGTYTGSRVSLEIMNTQYLLFREILQEYVENYLFKPVARKKGFIDYDKFGNEVLLYPKLTFTRLAIRDNEQFFDAAFQLYQKGSISVDLILEILNIDPVSTREKIEQDLFTVNDSQFNELPRNIYANAATAILENTDIVEKLADYMKLKVKPKEEKPAGEARFSSEDGNGKMSEEEFKLKMAKLMKYFRQNPRALERMFR